MKITDLPFTGYPVTNMARARLFYEGVLGLRAARTFGDAQNPQWVEYDIGAGCLALIAGDPKTWPPANGGPAVAFEVEDFDAALQELKAAGVKFVFEPMDHPTCRTVIVLDPDENRLALHHKK